MNRQQLEHIIRAAAANANVHEIIVIGSQAILGSFPDAPQELLDSHEADVFPKDAPERADVIDGGIGELSIFHDTFGYHAHGVGEETAVLPDGWRDRLVRIQNENTAGAIGWCLEPHDLAVSKLAAGRQKDLAFVETMVRKGLVSCATVLQRLAQTPRMSDPARALAVERLKLWGKA